MSEQIHVWIKAFIPGNVPGVTVTVPGAGQHSGKTMVPSTFWGDCFLTDQRDFDNALSAKARMTSHLVIEVSGKPAIVDMHHYCDITTEVDCEDGDEEGTGYGSTSKMKFGNLIQVGSPDIYTIFYSGVGSNPLVAASALVGEIDIEGSFTVSVDMSNKNALISFQGKVDDFPAYEAYASDGSSAAEVLFRIGPRPGATALDLGGPATRTVAGSAYILY